MSGPAFSPGPWRTDPDCGDEAVLARDGVLVADCCIVSIPELKSRTPEVLRANARLVAAAPTLYEALSSLTNDAAGLLGLSPEGLRQLFGNTNVAALERRIAEARAALAAAIGQQP